MEPDVIAEGVGGPRCGERSASVEGFFPNYGGPPEDEEILPPLSYTHPSIEMLVYAVSVLPRRWLRIADTEIPPDRYPSQEQARLRSLYYGRLKARTQHGKSLYGWHISTRTALIDASSEVIPPGRLNGEGLDPVAVRVWVRGTPAFS